MKKKIFVCDDDEGILHVTTILLEDLGYEVISLSNCKNIYTEIEIQKPSLILMDLWMPEISGEEVAQTLKSQTHTKHIPIIILSAHRETEKIAKSSGANDFLCKPYDIAQLEEKVKKLIED